METYPNFLPLACSAPLVKQWKSLTVGKCDQHSRIYYKSIEGKSEILFENQCSYSGSIKNGLYNGNGTFVWGNGLVYEGQWVDSFPSGNGCFTYPDGSTYRGHLRQGKKSGFGTYSNAVQGYTYEGQWQNNQMHGNGTLRYADKSTYTGQFNQNNRQGSGTLIYPSKNFYKGQWVKNKKHGFGTMNWVNKAETEKGDKNSKTPPKQKENVPKIIEKYIGFWKEDQQNGYGEYYWYENKIQFKIFKNVYKGFWKNGKREGFGMFLFGGGLRFEGFFRQDAKDGAGVIVDQCGIVKVLQYINNKPIQTSPKQSKEPQKKHPTKQSQPDIKLPPISQHQSSQSTHHQPSHQLAQHNPSLCSNEYKKYIDFSHPQLNQNFYNFLLRMNTKLKNVYKSLVTILSNEGGEPMGGALGIAGIGGAAGALRCEGLRAGSSDAIGGFQDIRMYYSGMLLGGFWKLIRDNKIGDGVSLVQIDRMFAKGSKNVFRVDLPDQRNIKVCNQLRNLSVEFQKLNYDDMQWYKYYQTLAKSNLSWQTNKLSPHKSCSSMPIPNTWDLHNPQSIILFRHFICLLIHISIMEQQHHSNSKTLKQIMETIINTLEAYIESINRNDKEKQKQKQKDKEKEKEKERERESVRFCVATAVPLWAKQANRKLYALVQKAYIDIDGRVDWSISVRKMFSILEFASLFKDVNEKILFLEKVERYLCIKNSSLRKQCRNSQFQRTLKQNPNLNYLLNIELTQKQSNQLIFCQISKKQSGSQQKSYTNLIEQLIKKLQDPKLISLPLSQCQSSPSTWSHLIGMLHKPAGETPKDKLKRQHLLKIREEEERQKQKIKEIMMEERENRERLSMSLEDRDVGDQGYQEQDDQEDGGEETPILETQDI